MNGHHPAEIADVMGISVRGIRHHLDLIYKKANVDSMQKLVVQHYKDKLFNYRRSTNTMPAQQPNARQRA
jgi:DNA-binding NarL/FixJ family response regulator